MKKTPIQLVKEAHGSKAALADKLLGSLERHEDEDDADFKQRIHTASNKQLLRLWAAEERVKSEFGSKDKLIDAVVKARFNGKDNADYRARVSKYAKTRLLDMMRHNH